MIRTLRLSAIALMGMGLCSCAALGPIAAAVTPAASAVVNTAVDIAVTAEILKDPATSKAKAVAFKAIATQVLADTKSPTVTIAVLQETLTSQLVRLAPDPVTAASVMSLTGGLQGALTNIIGTPQGGAVTQATSVAVSGIASEVIRVCGFYGA
jgi:hypothetical protein